MKLHKYKKLGELSRYRMSGATRLSARTLKPITIVAVSLAAALAAVPPTMPQAVLAGYVSGDDNSRASTSLKGAGASQSSGSSAGTTLKPSTCVTQALKNLGATCYEFTGQENWDHPNGKTVMLPVAVIPGSAPQLEPVFYLRGGPGSSVVGTAESRLRVALDVIKPRTLVLVESRGLAFAKPRLECPEPAAINHFLRQFSPDVYGMAGLRERIKQQADAVKGCYEKLTSEGVDVTQYTDYQITRDYDEVRKALGYDKINVWGWSAAGGTVESWLNFHGDHTRAAVMEAPWFNHMRNRPLADHYYLEKQIQNDLLSICVRDNAECASRFPDYTLAVDRAKAILDKKPYITTVTTETGGERKVRIDGATLSRHLAYGYFENNYHLMPKMLEGVRRGDYSVLDEFLELDAIDTVPRPGGSFATGHYYAVMCGDQVGTRMTPEETTREIVRQPGLMHLYTTFCAWWGEDGDAPAKLNYPPRTDVPGLAIHGQVDVEQGIRASQTLAYTMPNLQRVEIQAQRHQMLVGDTPGANCVRQLISEFLNAPDVKVDDSCKDDNPLRPWVFYDPDGRRGR